MMNLFDYKENIIMSSKKIIKVSEYYRSPTPLEENEKFTIEELKILESQQFSNKIQIISRYTGEQIIQTQEYVGYIILPSHIISIVPKIPQISFINMLRYAIGLAKLTPDEYSDILEEKNYYDILVIFLFIEIEKLLYQGLNTGYKIHEDNLSCVRGKILFKEHLNQNYNRNDKIFCSYSELTTDILENRIIKYTLYYLSQCYFFDDIINSKLLNYYNRLDQINLISISLDSFKLIEYTPLNQYYRPILALCELLLRDSSLNEETTGEEKIAISFLVDMNVLFEKFVVNLLRDKMENYSKLEIEEQKKEYADIFRKLGLDLDIVISYYKKPILILDTKYKEFKDKPDRDDFAQIITYSNSTGVKNSGLIYPGNKEEYHYQLHQDIKLNILFLDLQASNKNEFENKCTNFINSINSLIQSLIVKN